VYNVLLFQEKMATSSSPEAESRESGEGCRLHRPRPTTTQENGLR